MKILEDYIKDNQRYITAQPEGVCSYGIKLILNGDIVEGLEFFGGCNGNLKGIASLCKGQRAADVMNRLSGITCGAKNTSCPDQFACLLREII